MNPEAITWDAVIVGTGMGGATLGYALARAGQNVLFVERGLGAPEDRRIFGRFVEDDPGFRKLSKSEQRAKLAEGGRSADEIDDRTDGTIARFNPFVGCGTGGSSALYGMVLERLFPGDFAHDSVEWPIRYEDLLPWYESAESLYRVRGEPDPLRPFDPRIDMPVPALSPESAEIFGTLTKQKMHPYRLHTACEQVEGCATCQGHLCGRQCKNDAASICLTPAIERHGASLVTECVAHFLDADSTSVRRLVCSRRGQRMELRSKRFVLAAGGLITPALLLNSKSDLWPEGLANASGQVGRNLMRHAIDLYVLRKAPKLRTDGFAKEVGFNDFYETPNGKWGTVQSFGIASPLSYLQNRPGFNLWKLLGPMGPAVWEMFGRQPILGAIMEDSPNEDNRILSGATVDESGRYRLPYQYRLCSSDIGRRDAFRVAIAQVLAPFKPVRVRGTTDRPALGHVCGTCRFGEDPRTSVLDPWNRVHGLSNLYVVDASFFPSSGGINPALTIAANALRVAHHLNSV